jgi:hypothetical protein
MNPAIYGAWIEHIVRRGNIVIYPRYQASIICPTTDFLPNTVAAVKDALNRLETEKGHVRPQKDKFAAVGHSVGGLLAPNLAAVAAANGLPQPKAVMSVEPGNSWNPAKRMAVPMEDMSKLPPETLLLAVAGEDDNIVHEIDAKNIFNQSIRVPKENKDYVLLVSDDHGEPPLTADHFAPVALDASYGPKPVAGDKERGGPVRSRLPEHRQLHDGEMPDLEEADARRHNVNALDWYGTWKLFDALCDAAFHGRNREYALGNTPEQRFMGKWSDGVPVKELRVTDAP